MPEAFDGESVEWEGVTESIRELREDVRTDISDVFRLAEVGHENLNVQVLIIGYV